MYCKKGFLLAAVIRNYQEHWTYEWMDIDKFSCRTNSEFMKIISRIQTHLY
jgi:hypothetical protein